MKPLRWILPLLAAGPALLTATASAQYAPGKGSLGGTLGVPILFATSELRQGQHPRLMGKAHFQYVFTPDWRVSLRAGFGWLGHGEVPAPFALQAREPGGDLTRVDQLDTFVPVSLALAHVRNLSSSGNWKAFLGAGAGLYRVNILNDRRTIFDPVTRERFRFVSPGVNAELGAEHFLAANRNVSLEWLGTAHYLLRSNEDEFPSGYSGRYGFFDLSFGVNVYFRTSGADLQTAPAPTPTPAAPATPEAPAPADSLAPGGTPAPPDTTAPENPPSP